MAHSDQSVYYTASEGVSEGDQLNTTYARSVTDYSSTSSSTQYRGSKRGYNSYRSRNPFILLPLLLLVFLLVAVGLVVAFVPSVGRPSCYDPLDRDRIRREWRQETENYERLKERRRQEEEGRQMSRVAWIDFKGEDGCISYGTRKYSALLSNIPEGYDWMDACMGTPIDIHGVTFRKPDWCWKSLGRTYGTWIVNFSEPSCQPYWKRIWDKGCSAPGSGQRRFETQIEGVQQGDDWKEMCNTTPFNFKGAHLKGPSFCAIWGSSIMGVWDIDDSSC